LAIPDSPPLTHVVSGRALLNSRDGLLTRSALRESRRKAWSIRDPEGINEAQTLVFGLFGCAILAV